MPITRSQKKQRFAGGKVIAFGGSGCVFYPALKCKSRDPNKVSKLMKNSEANKEYENIMNIRSKLIDIPDIDDYFMLDVEKCKPQPLTESELNELDKCKSLFPKNINESIDEYTVINMPNGGQPIDDYIYDDGSFQKLYDVHLGLVKLLVNGIIPMNKMNIYHCDIKDSNILFGSDNKTRLIDWGLYAEYEPKTSFPQVWRNRPFQYNVPFSVILFTDLFHNEYAKFIKEEDGDVKVFVTNYVKSWMKERGAGHYDFIKGIMKLLFVNSGDINESENETYTMDCIVTYIVGIVSHYKSLRMEYLDNVFIKMLDIWGLIMAYYPILEVLSNNYSKLTKGEMKLFKQLQFIIVQYLYAPDHPHEPINMPVLFNDLDDLGKLFHIKLNGTLKTYISPFEI